MFSSQSRRPIFFIPPPPYTVSIIIPVLNETAIIQDLLDHLVGVHRPHEILIVDGGSTDGSIDAVQAWITRHRDSENSATTVRLLTADAGRGHQMNAAANQATGEVFLFLHADTSLPDRALTAIGQSIGRGAVWGRFDVCISDRRVLLSLVGYLINWRSAFSGIVTGDQALYVRADVFHMVCGFSEIPLMEDIEISHRLKRLAWPHRLRETVLTSPRRWRREGVFKTILKMWWLRSLYRLGVSPMRLCRWYRPVR